MFFLGLIGAPVWETPVKPPLGTISKCDLGAKGAYLGALGFAKAAPIQVGRGLCRPVHVMSASSDKPLGHTSRRLLRDVVCTYAGLANLELFRRVRRLHAFDLYVSFGPVATSVCLLGGMI